MAFAETQKLTVLLDLGGNLQSKIGANASALQGFERSTARVGGSLSKLGGVLNHAKGEIKNLITGPLGVIGLTGGLFSLGGVIESSLRHTSDFGLAIEKLTGLTGESAQSMGELLLVFEKYGINAERTAQLVGFAEKTLGKLAETSSTAGKSAADLAKDTESVTKAHEKLTLATLKLHVAEGKDAAGSAALIAARYHVRDATVALTDAENKLATDRKDKGGPSVSKLVELDRQFGLSLIDNKGKIVDYTTELKQVSDYYTSNAQAADKAHLAATLFGRGYADLIPILSLGSKGISDAEQAVADLGLSLGTDTQGALTAYKSSLRQVGEAIGILQTEIGLALIPTVVKLANGFTLFLEHGGTKTIAGFFQKAGDFAGKFVDVLANKVIPEVSALAGAANDFWNKIPAGLRDALFTGAIADRSIKFLFGVSPIKVVTGGIENALSKAIGSAVGAGVAKGAVAAGLGKLFVQPVFVTNPGFGLPGGGLPGGPIGAAEGAAEGGLTAGALIKGGIKFVLPIAAGIAIANAIKAVAGVTDAQQQFQQTHGQFGARTAGQAPKIDFSALANANAREDRGLLSGAVTSFAGKIKDDLGAVKDQLRGYAAEFKDAAQRLAHPKSNAELASAAKAITKLIGQGRGGAEQTAHVLASLEKQLAHTHDPKLQAALRADIAKVQGLLPGRQFAAKELANAQKILSSHESENKKIVGLQEIERALKDRGLPHAAATIAAKIEAAKRATTIAQHATTQAVKDKDLSVAVTVNTAVSVRDIISAARSSLLAGNSNVKSSFRVNF